ncbi:MAG TPA: uracil-DNA glycosylase [Flavobacteriales bacterium]|nr:uracil-DNA glycosylase [Flavobacteriales bacterium]HIO59508.1 uracil-DNA glycosylase [Flavobacteriales bacterium]
MSKELFNSEEIKRNNLLTFSSLTALISDSKGIGDWDTIFHKISLKEGWSGLNDQVVDAYCTGICYPKPEFIFRALRLCQLSDVKVVIVGQDPYHGVGQANGLSFSVDEGNKIPPSLRNIFVELEDDLGLPRRSSDLSDWALQGVLLLNSVLTVGHGRAGSHSKWGWEEVTSMIIEAINEKERGVCFVLWGGYALKLAPLIDTSRHTILSAPHPSPLSSYRGFFGSKPFSQINKILQSSGMSPIVW